MRAHWEKIAFVLSIVVLGYFYGYLSRAAEWFPHDVLQAAANTAVMHWILPPDYTAPIVYSRSGPRSLDGDAIQPGLTLITSVWKNDDDSWEPGLRLMDGDGRIYHEWLIRPAEIFSDSVNRRGIGLRHVDIHGSQLLPGGDVVLNLEYVGAVRIDACSRVRWSLSEGNHHSMARADDGSFWIPAVSQEVAARSEPYPDGFPGLEGRTVYQDRILNVSEDGEVLDEINVLDVLYGNDLQRYIVKASRRSDQDITHLNDVEPLSAALAESFPLFDAGDLLVSLRNLDLVLVVDPSDRRVEWHSSDPFIGQHDPDFLPGGWIGVFDNNRDFTRRGAVLGGSRIIALRPATAAVEILFPTRVSEPFHTEYRGKWQRLENGNLLLTEAAAGRIVEVAPDGRTVWDWVVEPYDEETIPLVSRGHRTSLTPEDVAEWPCSKTESKEAP